MVEMFFFFCCCCWWDRRQDKKSKQQRGWSDWIWERREMVIDGDDGATPANKEAVATEEIQQSAYHHLLLLSLFSISVYRLHKPFTTVPALVSSVNLAPEGTCGGVDFGTGFWKFGVFLRLVGKSLYTREYYMIWYDMICVMWCLGSSVSKEISLLIPWW